MSFNSYDQGIYETSRQAGGFQDQSPFVKRELIALSDNNNSQDYTSSNVVWECQTLSNNGRFHDFKEAFCVIPLVMQMNGTGAAAVDFTGLSADLALVLKNNLSLINSCTVEWGNSSVTNKFEQAPPYNLFLQHTSMSPAEMEQMGPLLGYFKDEAGSFEYIDASPSHFGVGICNNGNSPVENPSNAYELNSSFNTAINKRAGAFKNLITPSVNAILGDSEDLHFKSIAQNYTKSTAEAKYWYFNAIIRLADICPLFRADDFPRLIRSAVLKISITINQCFFTFAKEANGSIKYTAVEKANYRNNINGCCPLMVCANQVPIVTGAVKSDADVNNATAIAKTHYPCGSGGLTASKTYECSLSIGRTRFIHAYGAPTSGQFTSCKLYVHAYTMNPTAEAEYLSLGQKRITYNDVVFKQINNVASGQYFDYTITNGIARAKRMIIIPYLSASSNSTTRFSEMESMFSSAPSTCCPTILKDFQVNIGQLAMYPRPMNFTFETFMNEMHFQQGAGTFFNLFSGQNSGLISERDWETLYKYYVVDLRKILPEDQDILRQISITGTLASKMNVDFYVYIEYARTLTIDLTTGMKIE